MTHSPTHTIVTPAENPEAIERDNPIRALQRFGQSVWLDDLRRSLSFRDHGHLRATLEEGIPEARQVLEEFRDIGLSLRDVTDRLLEDGVKAFILAFDTLLAALDAQRGGAGKPRRE